MDEDVENITESIADEKPFLERDWVRNLKAAFSIIRFTVVILVAAMTYYVYQRDVNAQASYNLQSVQKDIQQTKDDLKTHEAFSNSTYVTRAESDAKFQATIQRLDRIETTLNQILIKP